MYDGLLLDGLLEEYREVGPGGTEASQNWKRMMLVVAHCHPSHLWVWILDLQAFHAVDVSGNGTLGATELARLFAEMGNPVTFEKLVAVMQEYDKDESGQV